MKKKESTSSDFRTFGRTRERVKERKEEEGETGRKKVSDRARATRTN